MRHLLRWSAGLLAVALVGLTGAPAGAHQADPRVVTVLDEVSPSLPSQVVVQVQANLATQLVVDNPTDTVLEVLGTSGLPFLRISSAGVLADVASEDFLTTANPDGAAPSNQGRDSRWAQISAGSSWGWYDHRLHPRELAAPADTGRQARLASFEVPLRYGEQPVTVRGHVEFQPLLGAFQVVAGQAPEGLVVQALPGKLPGVFLSNPGRLPLTVLGRDGEPFLRFGEGGLEVNENSRTHVEDRQARGLPAGAPSPTPSFRLVDARGTSYTWLDARLRYPEDLPPESVLRASEPTVLSRWEVPITLAGGPAVLTGEVSWVPEPNAAALVAAPREVQQPGPSVLPLVLGGVALMVLAGVVVGLRRRRP